MKNTTMHPEKDTEKRVPVICNKLTYIDELNPPHSEATHKNLTGFSRLEADFRSITDLYSPVTNAIDPCYVRIKQLKDGSFFMLYNEEINGLGIRMLKSKDGKTWEEYSTLFEPTGNKRYANPEVIILANGDILACAAWRLFPEYHTDNTAGGIETVRSQDGGKTWSKPQLVHTGLTWEPYFLQLRSGEIHLYWTNTTRYNLPGGNNTSTGTAILRSYDNGYTWNSDPKKPYDAQIVSQQPSECYDGVQFYTDQMPVARELQNGTIVLSLESRMDRKGKCDVSLAYSDDNWATAIPVDGEGPADKNRNMYHGGAPYLDQFTSGETAFKYQQWRSYYVRLGDYSGRDFSAPPIRLSKMINFGGFEKLNDEHSLLCSGCVAYTDKNGEDHFFIRLHTVRLNHAIFCGSAEDIKIDGNSEDWENNRQALFVGSKTQAQASFRFARNKNRLCVLIDRADTDITEDDTCTLLISMPENKEDKMVITVSPKGITESYALINGERSAVESNGKVTLFGTLDNSEDTDQGYLAEIEIFSDTFQNGSIRVLPSINNRDGDQPITENGWENTSQTDSENWMPVFFDAN